VTKGEDRRSQAKVEFESRRSAAHPCSIVEQTKEEPRNYKPTEAEDLNRGGSGRRLGGTIREAGDLELGRTNRDGRLWG